MVIKIYVTWEVRVPVDRLENGGRQHWQPVEFMEGFASGGGKSHACPVTGIRPNPILSPFVAKCPGDIFRGIFMSLGTELGR